ncbi:flavin-containing monooxygenase [Chelativorans intermedius]|uniref:Flavin-containing monooxygenase n=1 Tax=Chelativorans intermedius TaxID=515947 RepID=A0ABV6D2L4_9HYPH|nr:NAD(P)/FAD-dependent oxidoreductase [Chelativorans intermedius]MCT8997298.1 NAD(P)/FAD-dependent oxidoreductase [Chelativorans intermedius]
MHRTDTVIIGAGQAGLAMSWLLNAEGIPHVVLERGRLGERWRSERWPTLRLLTPNWMTRLPGHRYAGADPDGFMRACEFVGLLERYAADCGLNVREGASVTSVESEGAGYLVRSTAGTWFARAVVIATGAFQDPHVPEAAARLPRDILQLTPNIYRGPDRLPGGGVLVVGASATGVQLAAEIHRAGHAVTIAVGRHVRVPRRYRGRDVMYWLDRSGFLAERRPEDGNLSRLASQPSMQLIGDPGGSDLDLGVLHTRGVRIVGRVLGAEGAVIALDPDLPREIDASERRRATMLDHIDGFIARTGIDAPAAAKSAAPAFGPGPCRLDLGMLGIGTVVWATGYRRSYPWLKLPVFAPDGEIAQIDGVTACPGVYTLGLRYQRHRASNFIDGVGRDAAALLPILKAHLAQTARRAA